MPGRPELDKNFKAAKTATLIIRLKPEDKTRWLQWLENLKKRNEDSYDWDLHCGGLSELVRRAVNEFIDAKE